MLYLTRALRQEREQKTWGIDRSGFEREVMWGGPCMCTRRANLLTFRRLTNSSSPGITDTANTSEDVEATVNEK